MSQMSFGGAYLSTSKQLEATEVEQDTPFRIAILGDFSGRASRGVHEIGAALASRRPLLVDRDNLDQVLDKLQVQLSRVLVSGDQTVSLRFHTLDDFHPDQLFTRVPLFAALRDTRQRLTRPDTQAQAAAEVRQWAKLEHEDGGAAASTPVLAAQSSDPASLLDQMLDDAQPSAAPTQQANPAVDARAMLRQIVQPYLVNGADPQQEELIGCVDRASSELMRALLDHEQFQQLEAAWRGVELLVRNLETGSQLKLFLLDISQEELRADLTSRDELRGTGIHRLLVDQSTGPAGEEPWALLIGMYYFDASDEDIQLLDRLGQVAQAAGAPLLAGARNTVLGCATDRQQHDPDEWAQAMAGAKRSDWQHLRGQPAAAYLGLAWPRFRLRLPYGAETDAIDSFALEELGAPPAHDSYLWGNPALIVGCLLGRSYTGYGWSFKPGQEHQLDGLPMHILVEDGQHVAQPCGELLLGERALERIVAAGLIPLLSLKNQDRVQVGSFQSLSGQPIAGRWA